MLLKIYEDNPSDKILDRVVSTLQAGGVIVYPTDSIYAFGCSLKSPQGVAKLEKVTDKDSRSLTLICSDLSNIADYASVDNATFRVLKRNLPGPFTFILKASSRIPDRILGKRKSMGIRVPENPITRMIVERLGCPMVSSSVKDSDDVVEYTTDPELIHEKYGDRVDIVVDGGYGGNIPTTIVDLTDGDPQVMREGRGELI